MQYSLEDGEENISETLGPCNIEENIMNFGNLIFPLPEEIKKKIREVEKASYKLNAVETAVIFNKVCLKEGLYPK